MDDSGQKITMEDPFGNKMEMGVSGISIDSNGKIDISGKLGVSISGTTMVDISSIGPTNVKGSLTNITGNISAVMSAPTATVSGQMVATLTGMAVVIG